MRSRPINKSRIESLTDIIREQSFRGMAPQERDHQETIIRLERLQLDIKKSILHKCTHSTYSRYPRMRRWNQRVILSTLFLGFILVIQSNVEAARNHRRSVATDLIDSQATTIKDYQTSSEEIDKAYLLHINKNLEYDKFMPKQLTQSELNKAIIHAALNVSRLRNVIEPALKEKKNLVTASGSSAWLAGSIFHSPILDIRTLNLTYYALMSEEASKYLTWKFNLNMTQAIRGLPMILSVDQTILGRECPRPSKAHSCSPGRYRSHTGHCNNVQNPDWGTTNTQLLRSAPARYADFISKPILVSKTPLHANQSSLPILPSSRAISLAIFEASKENDSQVSATGHLTTLLSFFGQFIMHDLVQVSQYTMGYGSWANVKCCGLSTAQRHPECYPIEYKDFCLDYVRSLAATRCLCNLGARDQMNLVSSFLDGSTIYGSNEEQARDLRSLDGGKLRATSSENSGDFLPDITSAQQLYSALEYTWYTAAKDCQFLARLRKNLRSKRHDDSSSLVQTESNCFQAGDFRVNENIGLTLMHTIWMREHNYIATKLSQINPHWLDERLYEEARRIVIAELQHITYNELLPALLGKDLVDKSNLTLLRQGYSQSYDPKLDPGVSNEFASIILPYIKSIIPATLVRYDEKLENLGNIATSDTFMNVNELMKQDWVAQYLRGMIAQHATETTQGMMAVGVNPIIGGNFMANRSESNDASTIDSVAITIQQSRDHGLRGYLYWREICDEKPRIRDWRDLEQVMPAKMVDWLSRVYLSPAKLDLYVALLENPLPGAAMGPVLACITKRQFNQTRHGDRFWYENDLPDGSGSFTLAQLDEIRQTSLAKILCRNTDAGVSFVQPDPLVVSDPYLNAYQYCSSKIIGEIDLTKWYEPLTTAKQKSDEQIMNDLRPQTEIDQPVSVVALGDDSPSVITSRGKRSSLNLKLVESSLSSARRRFEDLAHEETKRMRAIRAQASKRPSHHHGLSGHAGFRLRPKRQALLINNQSQLLELATNELVRSLLHQGRDRERTQSIQADVRELLSTLESAQLDNLIDNLADDQRIRDLVSAGNSGFLTPEQRSLLVQANDPTFGPDPMLESSPSQAAVSPSQNDLQCQDDARFYPCDYTSPFRTITGWCNNLNNPKFGMSFTQHDRILPSFYDDGYSQPRTYSVLAQLGASSRSLLPSPRLISTTIHDSKSRLHPRYSLALMQFGQFAVDHDLTRTPFSVAIDGSLLDCSPCDSHESVHRDCIPIQIPAKDHFYHSHGTDTKRRCLHFVRSMNGQSGLGPRQQMNAITSYFDASQIYGSDNCEAKSLRLFQGGKLNSSVYLTANLQRVASVPNARELLPTTKANAECVTPGRTCFHAGDQRASEQPGLSAIHTIFMRLHNYIVGQLGSINRQWSDEKLYQHGRRIVGAISQRIAYNEFVPRLLGLDHAGKYDLLLKETGYSDGYDESCSASTINEFSSAAFRMGHSLVRNSFPLLDKDFVPIGQMLQLRKAFFNTQRIMTEPQLIDSLLRGIVTTPVESFDNSVSDEVTNHLFEKPKEPFSGMDLVALNIQRGRDHGIRGYNEYRAICNLTKAKTFQDLSNEISAELITRLEGLYAHVDDIDLFTGGLSESSVHGGLVGPTFACIIGMQFNRLKRCDRFWHETNDPWVRFSPPQLAEIRKMTLSKVICQQSDSIDMIQRHAMDVNTAAR